MCYNKHTEFYVTNKKGACSSMTQLTTANSLRNSWKQLKESHSTVNLDYYLMFPKNFSPVEDRVDNETYGCYWRLRNWIHITGGVAPYDIRTIRHVTRCGSIKTAEKRMSAILELDEFEVVDFREIPEFFKNF